jgi:ABC-type glycerol-3-phosphate transport system permease component
MAALTLAAIPVIVIFAYFQQYIVVGSIRREIK